MAPTRRGRRLLRSLRRPFRARFGAASPVLPVVQAGDEEAAYRPIDLALIRRMLGWLRPYARRYALGIALGMVMVLLEMASPMFMREIINVATGATALSDRLLPATTSPAMHLVAIVGVWAVALGTALVLQRATIFIMTGAGERVQYDLRRRLFAHLQTLSMSFYDRTKLGRIISRCTSDLNGMRDVNVWGINTVVKNTLIMIVASAMLLVTEPRLFLAVVWLAPLLFLINRYFRRRLSAAWQIVREGYTRVSTNLAENITGVRVVTAFARQDWNLEAFNALQEANTRNNIRAARIKGVYQPSLQLIGFAGRAIILIYGGYLVTVGSIEGVGSVVAAFLYWDLLMGPILTFGNFHNQLMMAMAGGERIMNLLDTEPEVSDLPDAHPLPPVRGHVRFEHVTFGYDPARPVLHDIELEARPGQTIALVGPTGSGKSSIISLIARFYQPKHGCIRVDGHDIRHVIGDSLHRQMGLVLQTNFLFSGTVLDNLRYARPDATEDEVIAAARAIGSLDTIRRLPDGLNTEVGERGSNMSLGQRQLICFTRVFLADPRILLLDEATSAVDAVTEQLVQRSLARLLTGRTTFVVAHRLSTITRADQILCVEQGRIVERGTHTELIRTGGKYAALYRQFVASVA